MCIRDRGWTCAKYLLTYERTGIAGVGFSVAALEKLKVVASKVHRNGKPLSQDLSLIHIFKVIEAVQAGLDLPFDEALKFERQLFLQCIDSPQRAGLIHAFFAEREVVKVPEAQAAKPRAIASVGVVGGGTMGAGIAVSALDLSLIHI